MFVLADLQDEVTREAKCLGTDFLTSVRSILNKKFANKIVHNVGVCTALWDIVHARESFIFPGNSASHTIVDFRFVVWRPFIDEILTGKVKSSSREGLNVTMGFFDDISIPADNLPTPSTFEQATQTWVWQYEVQDQTHHLAIEHGEDIRFRVKEEVFVDKNPDSTTTNNDEDSHHTPPYSIVGSISEAGLGLLCWWT